MIIKYSKQKYINLIQSSLISYYKYVLLLYIDLIFKKYY
jgi:hypothetical protein